VREIPLRGKRGGVALVDDEDYERLSRYPWRDNGHGYAVARYGSTPGEHFMHHLICPVPAGLEVDHINQNKLDNRRANLRPVTHAQNAHNVRGGKANKTGHAGVSWDEKGKCWRAKIVCRGRKIQLGTFRTAEQAARAYERAWHYRREHGCVADHLILRRLPERRKGEGHHSAKLTRVHVEEIRARYAKGGIGLRPLASEYRVDRSTIQRIVRHICWRS
jgi:hypothetical protein